MTYPEEMVVSTVEQRFVPCKVNVLEDAGKPTVARYRQAWTPDVRVLDHDGFELYQWNGYLPPYEFVPRLLTGEGQAYLRMGLEERAEQVFTEVVRRFPTSAAAPESQYFAAVAKYKASHEGSDLVEGWKRLRSRYPDSNWRLKQVFTEQ